MKMISSSLREFCGFQPFFMSRYQSDAIISTKEGSSYIRKLCRHFANKIVTSYTETDGRAIFPEAVCLMQATGEQLTFTITAATEAIVIHTEGVVVRHLVKFAFREELVINWQRKQLLAEADNE